MKANTLELFPSESNGKKRRKASGESSTNAILSSHGGDNADLFPTVLSLHVKKGSRIADVTYGTGVFWSRVDVSEFEFHPSDMKSGVDARALPYIDNWLDALVLDPPYMEGLYRKAQDQMAGGGSHDAFRSYYSDGKATETKHGDLKYHDAVVDMYMRCALEARRVLKQDGIFIVKCQDEVSANRQKLTHVELIYGFEAMGFYCKDLFVYTRSNKPVVARLLKQEHARKNHSYFLVFVNKKEKKLPHSNFRPMLRGYAQTIKDD